MLKATPPARTVRKARFFGLEPSRIIEIGSIGLNPTSVSLLGLS